MNMSDSTDDTETRLRARLHRSLRTAILASRRAPDNGQIARRRRALLRHVRGSSSLAAPAPSTPLLGVCAFNSPDLHIPEISNFRYPILSDPNNYTCQHCRSQLWWEERSLNCCKSGAAAIPHLRPVSDQIWRLFNTKAFSSSQRSYNGLFSFTALAAGGCETKTWTNPAPPSMLTLHGKAYHRIFDLQEKYETTNVSNSARFYIYDSEFVDQAQHLGIDLGIAKRCATTYTKTSHGLSNIVLLSMILSTPTLLVPNLRLLHLRKLAESTMVMSSDKKYPAQKSRL